MNVLNFQGNVFVFLSTNGGEEKNMIPCFFFFLISNSMRRDRGTLMIETELKLNLKITSNVPYQSD